jgi:tRNA (cytidine/uridine-2'-O-)-methyltransferase
MACDNPSPPLKIVLYCPEIPGNTGSIGRTALALNCELILIRPYGFDLSEKQVRRAGLDYWKFVNIKEYENWEEFMKVEAPPKNLMYLIETGTPHSLLRASFHLGSYLIFGGETKGIPEPILDHYKENTFYLPMYSEHIRSLNLSNAVTATCYLALKSIEQS